MAMHPILTILKLQGPCGAAQIGRQLGTTAENARQQLQRLEGEGFVMMNAEGGRVGRPQHVWSLTPDGHAAFPDTHGEFASRLLHAIRETFGDDALSQIVDLREAATKIDYRVELSGLPSLEARVARLAELREREGYMAEWHAVEDGVFELIENHCPICTAARTCVAICAAELTVFRSVLGPRVGIERTEHIVAGKRRCVYRIATLRGT